MCGCGCAALAVLDDGHLRSRSPVSVAPSGEEVSAGLDGEAWHHGGAAIADGEADAAEASQTFAGRRHPAVGMTWRSFMWQALLQKYRRSNLVSPMNAVAWSMRALRLSSKARA